MLYSRLLEATALWYIFILYILFYRSLIGYILKGDIAIDDVTVTNGLCDSNKLFECDFENPDICGFKSNSSTSSGWNRKKGKIGENYGPTTDHTVITVYFYIIAHDQFYLLQDSFRRWILHGLRGNSKG